MDRRFANLSALIALVLVAVSLHVNGASTQCGPDATTLINGKMMPVMAAVESSASTHAAETKTPAKLEKGAVRSEKTTVSSVEITQVTDPATAGGGAAGGGDDGVLGDGGNAPGAHKRGLRWQSFLPGVIR
jgi:hypothetical protein